MAQLLLKGHPIGNFNGVLFDKDGTLSHSEPHLLELAECRMTTALDLWIATGRSPHPELRTLLSRAFGLEKNALDPGGTLAVAARQDNLISTATVFCLLGCSWPEALNLAEACFERVDQAAKASNRSSSSPLLSHARGTLQHLKGGGMQLAVISNDTRSGIESFLEDHGLSALFSSCWSADDQPRKPNPDAVHELCRSLNIPPKRCVLLGDAETDLSMARAAGVGTVIGYTGGWARQPELPSADHLLADWKDLGIAANP